MTCGVIYMSPTLPTDTAKGLSPSSDNSRINEITLAKYYLRVCGNPTKLRKFL